MTPDMGECANGAYFLLKSKLDSLPWMLYAQLKILFKYPLKFWC
ncbi:hypothetical protein SAMN05192529_10833 [Arachidicoccus rhizosphaerae]|uniref:Uncharacterized protein n=1 Tax=Arachidicoccus rhizosphaerae TaxID=551991 RepID=A0A1H3YG10_9BACT|nr:hypothetical protein SAMN05192529_10833 [Arachidicoccus rhizosphaerae]